MTETPQQWTVAIAFDQTVHHTRAHAVLRSSDGDEFSGIGLAHSQLEGRGLAHVAGYLAAGRALCDLSQELLEAVATDVDAAMGELSAAAPTSPPEPRRPGAIRA
ncbi:dsRBD fold-containing protein [Amycolatopsis benzoatilytica]|uniref:dsRBD fold-containing protein n=1 Tax=Amycolatopsis benzoatilytica TaxID=346045 RepID=UPI00035C656B|nr:dsRBD fold-containing protein [Amycolatopsis benzoatilytica]